MGVQFGLTKTEIELSKFYRDLRYGPRRMGTVAAAQYVSFIRSVLTAAAAGHLVPYLSMLGASTRAKIRTVWSSYCEYHSRAKLQPLPQPLPDETEVAAVNFRPVAPSAEKLKALRLLSGIAGVAPTRLAATPWSAVSSDDDGPRLRVTLGGRGRTYYQTLGPLGNECLRVLRERDGFIELRPTSVILPATPLHPSIPPTRKLLEGWMADAGVPPAGPWLDDVVETNLRALGTAAAANAVDTAE